MTGDASLFLFSGGASLMVPGGLKLAVPGLESCIRRCYEY